VTTFILTRTSVTKFMHDIYITISKNFKCKEQTEIQSDYFQKQEVSIHVTLIYRHAMLNADGVQSRPMIPLETLPVYIQGIWIDTGFIGISIKLRHTTVVTISIDACLKMEIFINFCTKRLEMWRMKKTLLLKIFFSKHFCLCSCFKRHDMHVSMHKVLWLKVKAKLSV
jgi:hypothetical protein